MLKSFIIIYYIMRILIFELFHIITIVYIMCVNCRKYNERKTTILYLKLNFLVNISTSSYN